MYYSPLRYPGGKARLSAFIAKVCMDNEITGHYVEPYSGGAAVALFLLMEGYVEKITINDKDRSIYAFWHSVLYRTDELCNLIENAKLDVDEWRRQREVQNNKADSDLLDLGFSTFYQNRTNRSGIIQGGLMGGIDQQGKYPMDCRFNKADLIKRIKNIAQHRENINLYGQDAVDLIDKIELESANDNVIFYFDPPYYNKASTLYMNHYKDDNHKTVRDKIKSIDKIKWIVSYDNVPEIQQLSSSFERKEFSFKHTAHTTKVGKEVIFFSDNLIQPSIKEYEPSKFKKSKKNKEILYKLD